MLRDLMPTLPSDLIDELKCETDREAYHLLDAYMHHRATITYKNNNRMKRAAAWVKWRRTRNASNFSLTPGIPESTVGGVYYAFEWSGDYRRDCIATKSYRPLISTLTHEIGHLLVPSAMFYSTDPLFSRVASHVELDSCIFQYVIPYVLTTEEGSPTAYHCWDDWKRWDTLHRRHDFYLEQAQYFLTDLANWKKGLT